MPTEIADATPETMSFDCLQVRRLLPHRGWMALLDRVESYRPHERRLSAVKVVSQDEPTLRGHFPGHPVFPGTMLIESLAQACGLMMNAEHHLRHGVRLDRLDPADGDLPTPLSVLAESRVTLGDPACPGDRIDLEAIVQLQRRELYYFKARALVRGAEIASGTIMLAYPDYMAAG